jgi:transposase
VHPNERLQLWCEDEARVGQKGRTCHRWYERGIRPPGLADKRFASLYLFAACRPGTDQAFALALPEATAASRAVFLERFARELEPGAHAALILDRAGWHVARGLTVPANVTLVPLPPYSPELNPVERVWLYLRERFLSLRLFRDYRAIVDACCIAWNRLVADPGRLRSLCDQPWIRNVSS